MPRVMEIVTPLGEDVLLFHGMSAREEMSRPFEYQLDLLSTHDDVVLDDILGKNVTIKFALPDDRTRYFNGYITRFSQGGMYGRYNRYIATVRPWLWFLTRTADCRIFQEMKVPDIIKAVFSDHPSADFKLELTGTYRKWTYCVQYRETDFNFVSRLMEQEGICYYFRHTDGHDTLVLTDSTSKHTPVSGYEKLSFVAPTEQVKPDLEHVQRVELRARDPARCFRARRLRPRAAERRAQDQQDAAARLQAERLRGVRLSGALHPAAGRRAVCVRPDRRDGLAVRVGAGRHERARADASGRSSRSRIIRARIRTAST